MERIIPHHHQPEDTQALLLEALPDEDTVRTVSYALSQLGDPSRLRIFWLLCHTEECVADIARYVSMSSPAVSHHLRLLKAAGLIVYRAADSGLVDMLHHTIEKIAEISCPA